MAARYFDVHPCNPQPRSLNQVTEILRSGGLVAYPTDSGFALGCVLGNRDGLDRIRHIRELDSKHDFTLMISEFAQVGNYVEMGNSQFRLIKAHTPGPYTFILHATREAPKVMLNSKKKTVGVRVSDHVTAHALLDTLGAPLMTSTLLMPGETDPMSDGWTIADELGNLIDAVIDSGDVGHRPTTVVDLTGDLPVVVRVGAGDPSPFEA